MSSGEMMSELAGTYCCLTIPHVGDTERIKGAKTGRLTTSLGHAAQHPQGEGAAEYMMEGPTHPSDSMDLPSKASMCMQKEQKH